MLATFTNPTFYDVITDLVTLPKLPHILYSYLIFIGQPDDGLHTGPKHVVSYYISLLTVILFSSWLYACMYGYIQTAALYYKYRLHQIKCRHLCTLNINYHWILALNIVITTEISAVSVAIFTVRHTVGAAFTVKCFKLLHRLPAVDGVLIYMFAMLACVDVFFWVVIWRAAEFHCHSTLPFITTFISCIDDNECLHTITLMYLSLLSFVFTNWHHFVFSIKVLVNKAVSSYCKQRFWTTKWQTFVSKLRPETPSGSQWPE